MRQFLLGLALLVGAILAFAPSAGAKDEVLSLDGTTYKVAVKPDDQAMKLGGKEFDDELIFKNGKLTSSACIPHGFQASPYTVRRSGDKLVFECVQTSTSSGKNEWKGQVDGDRITGTVIMNKQDGKVLHYHFSGKKKASS